MKPPSSTLISIGLPPPNLNALLSRVRDDLLDATRSHMPTTASTSGPRWRNRPCGFFTKTANNVTDDGTQVDFLELESKTARGDARNVHQLRSALSSVRPVDLPSPASASAAPARGAWGSCAAAGAASDLQLQRGERGPQLVRRHRKKFVPRVDRIDRLAIEKLTFELRVLRSVMSRAMDTMRSAPIQMNCTETSMGPPTDLPSKPRFQQDEAESRRGEGPGAPCHGGVVFNHEVGRRHAKQFVPA